MSTSVWDACFDSGGRKAGTPSEIASTPVIAEQPFENAVRSMKVVSALVPAVCSGVVVTMGTTLPVTTFHRPAKTRLRMAKTKKYVGMEKIRPASRRPRRLPAISRITKPRTSSTGRGGARETPT